MSEPLVTPAWLAARLDDPQLVILDCTWFVPEMKISGLARFEEAHIPKAQFIDLDDISDLTSPYINMMPSADIFAREMGKLGIDAETTVVVYNSNYVSARLWWMFRTFGHDKVKILNGGWRKWLAEGRTVEIGRAHV